MAEIDDFWKCPKHPSRRHRVGICAACLRDRLLRLCPNCANSLPCPCSNSISSSSSSTSTSSIASSIGAIGCVSALIESEPSFRRSRSAAVPFLSSRFSERCVGDTHVTHVPNRKSTSSSVWSSVFNLFKSEVRVEEKAMSFGMTRSKSVSVWRAAMENGKGGKGSLGNGNCHKGWHFPSPMKVFRQSKPRSPMYRG